MKDYYSVARTCGTAECDNAFYSKLFTRRKLHGTKAGGKWRFTEQDLYDFLYGVEETNQDQENKQIFEAPVHIKIFTCHY